MRLYGPGRPKEFNPFTNRDNSRVPPDAGGEYRILDVDKKIQYIGYTISLKRRMHEHMRSGKLGGENSIFAFKVADGRASRERLAQHEAEKIRKHSPELNQRAGGAGRPFKRKKAGNSGL
ncbi:GIY-YIG nuclease family protein [Ruminococcus albus]|uniref:GIY-YIG catalytic domain-containing protein n=1 Tax=Ruminococcus albus TaxID=1264 RepID=A0A1I1R7D9_RUMAL|nr:GIY-YIG nuclease family protein [Ruminococcus albus]SFD30229.1 GIY-YIG catalytic domain-containing protein [Ruminococcus albus]